MACMLVGYSQATHAQTAQSCPSAVHTACLGLTSHPIPSHPFVVHDPPLAPPSHCCFSQEGVLGPVSILILASRGESCNESPSIAVSPGTGMLPFLRKLSAERIPPEERGRESWLCWLWQHLFWSMCSTLHSRPLALLLSSQHYLQGSLSYLGSG